MGEESDGISIRDLSIYLQENIHWIHGCRGHRANAVSIFTAVPHRFKQGPAPVETNVRIVSLFGVWSFVDEENVSLLRFSTADQLEGAGKHIGL